MQKIYQKYQRVKTTTPRYSYGLILFDQTLEKICLIQRKDSFGYITCIQNNSFGHTDLSATLQTITEEEKKKLLTWPWHDLWQDVQTPTIKYNSQLKLECKKRFEWLDIRNIIKSMAERGHSWEKEQKWSLPKGRMELKDNENTIRCATREVQEETSISSNNYQIKTKLGTFSEKIIGTNGKIYQYEYFAAIMKEEVKTSAVKLREEVSQIGWFNLEECQAKLEPSTFELIYKAKHKLQDNLNLDQ